MKKTLLGTFIVVAFLIVAGCDPAPRQVEGASSKLPDINSPEAAKGGTVIARDGSGDK